jgi:hypothetical protein
MIHSWIRIYIGQPAQYLLMYACCEADHFAFVVVDGFLPAAIRSEIIPLRSAGTPKAKTQFLFKSKGISPLS